jgi:hypothetical protein
MSLVCLLPHNPNSRDIDAHVGFEKPFKAGCRAAKHCLIVGDLELGAKLIDRLAERQATLDLFSGDLGDEAKRILADVTAEMLLLQMTLVCYCHSVPLSTDNSRLGNETATIWSAITVPLSLPNTQMKLSCSKLPTYCSRSAISASKSDKLKRLSEVSAERLPCSMI